MSGCEPVRPPRGFILLISMIFLGMMTILTAAALGVARLEARMAGNTESRMHAFELAESVQAEILQSPDNFPLSSEPGAIPCPAMRRLTAVYRNCL